MHLSTKQQLFQLGFHVHSGISLKQCFRMFSIVGRTFVLGLLVAVPYLTNGEKWWPDFSCHPIKESKPQRRAASFNRMGWKNCVEYNEKHKAGNCPRICMLVDEKLVYQKEKPDGPVIFDTDKFIAYFAEEVGYQLDKPEVADKQRLEKVRAGINDCKKKNPEYEGLKDLKTAVCEPWENLLQCLDKAIVGACTA